VALDAAARALARPVEAKPSGHGDLVFPALIALVGLSADRVSQTPRMPFCGQCGTENPEVAKFCFACGAALVTAAPAPEAAPAPPHESRKIVTIVFSDLKGSTAMGEKLDSESLREVMTRYFEAMSAELERHGGVVEKFIGDAIMAVFGLPKLHEDDALRAVRAAADMRKVQERLNVELESNWGVRLTVRTGVNTGPVVAGAAAEQRLVTGDAVNVAARLEQAADAQEILLGDLTYRLVRDFVDVEEVEPLELKGKSEPVPAYRLVGVREASERPRRLDSPLVGRADELELMREALARVVDDRRGRLVTIVGEAGVGKSRLVDEFVRSLDGDARFLRGRCLPYGDGITYWPLAEAVRHAAGILERDSTEVALQKLSTLSGDAEAEERVASAIGLLPAQFPGEELAWGARKLLEALARPGPLVMLFEDIHWAEPTFLELVQHVVHTAEDAALLVVCTARPDVLERMPDWSTDESEGQARIVLERLGESEASEIAAHLLGRAGLDERISARVVEASEGNPLFVEQMISMLIDEGLIRFGNGRWKVVGDIEKAVIPPTIQALLAARLDYLGADERAVIEPASVVGHVFVQDAVAYLAPGRIREQIGEHLGALTEKQLVQPDLTRSLAEEAFRFHHILIRDTAYEGILKRARATYHEQLVEWADSFNREGATEYEEVNGYHLEQAHRYLSELAPLDLHARSLALDGSRRLASAGRRAFARGDVHAAANLLGRAVALLPEDESRLQLLPDYGEALLQLGRFDEAAAVLDEAIKGADEARALEVRANAALVRLLVRLRTGTDESWRDDAAVTIAEAMAVFEAQGDDRGLAKGWRLLSWTHGTACHFGLAAETSERAIEHAGRAGDTRQQTQAATAYAAAAVFGPTPVEEAVERCERIIADVSGDRHSEGILLALLASLHAMQGSSDQARELIASSRAMLEDLGLRVRVARVALEAWRVEMQAGDVVEAERLIREGYDLLVEMGEKYLRSTLGGLLGQTLYALGRFDEVEALGIESRELATDDDVDTQALWRCVLSKVYARRGEVDEGEALVRDALQILEPTDAVLLKFGAQLDRAEVLRLAGRMDESVAVIRAAAALAEAKGASAMVAATSAMLAAATERTLAS
jgi:class 3 adenylate cyclase/tetratricopeptide (TPR) repeat protein